MPTTRINVTDTWVEAAAADKEFLIENQSSYGVKVAFADSTPAEDAPAHILLAGEALIRVGLVGIVYVKDANTEDNSTPFVVVSTS